MRKLVLLALMGIAVFVNAVKAQDIDKVYDFVSIDKQPEFPGGMKRFYEYLGQAIKYPELAKRNNVEGKVFLSFVVEKNGQLSDVKVTRGLGSGTDEEAIRVLKNSPAWNPGLDKQQPVRVKYNINVNFSLSKNKPEQKTGSVHKNLKAEFPGGEERLRTYLAKNIQYTHATQTKKEGKVYVSFLVGKDGVLSELKVIKGLSGPQDEEALRVMRKSPRWNPAIENGKPVEVKYVLPINFKTS